MSTEEVLKDIVKHRKFAPYFKRLNEPGFIESFIAFCYQEKYPYPEYSSWFLAHISEHNPKVLYPFQEELIRIWIDHNNHSLKRNMLKVLTNLPFTEHHEGEYLDELLKELSDPNTKVAVKAYGIRIIWQFIQKYPEIEPEVISILDAQYNNSTTGFQSSVRWIKKMIDKTRK